MEDEQGDAVEGEHAPLGVYGVLIIPPTAEDGGWLISVAGWDPDLERYVAGGEGPILETREEALQEADRVMDWLQTSEDVSDPVHAWDRMQRARAAAERGDDPPRPWGRF